VRGVDGNRHWADGGDENLQRSLVVLGHVLVAAQCCAHVGRREFAGSIHTLVGVAGFGIDAVIGDDVLEGVVHQTAVAALVAKLLRAVHQILLRERNQIAGG